MEAAQDLAKTAGEVAHNDQNITTLIKHIKEDETGDYITRLAKKNMQSTKSQMAVLKETLWATGIMIGKELLPTVNKVAQSLGKWTVSKEGKQTIKDVTDMVSGLLTGITKRSGSILKFLEGAVTGVKDIGKVTEVVFAPVVKLFDMMSGKKGDGAKWMGRIAGWFIAGAGAVKLFNAVFGWTIAGFRDLRAMAKNGLFGSKLTEEQTQLMGVNTELKTTNDLLSQIQQKQIDVSQYAQQVADATAYKSEHGPLGEKKPSGVEDANSDLPIINYDEGGKTAEKATQGPENAGKWSRVEKYTAEAAQEQGKNIGKEISEGVAKSGAAEQTGTKFAQTAGEAVEKSDGLAKGVEGAVEAAGKSAGVLSKAASLAGKIGNVIGVAMTVYDIGYHLAGAIKSASKDKRLNEAAISTGKIIGFGIGAAIGGPIVGGIVSEAGGVVGAVVNKVSPKKTGKEFRLQRQGGITAANLGKHVVLPTTKKPILTKAQTKEAEELAKTVKKLSTTNLELKVGVNSKSIKKTGATLENMYRSMQKSADKASTARMKSEKKALDFAIKAGIVKKKDYDKINGQIEKADQKRRKHNKNVADNLVNDTKAETKERAKAYDQYYKELKKKGVSQKGAQIKLNNALRMIDFKYAASRKKNEKALTKALEKTWNTSNNKQLSKMKSIVKKKGKLSEKEAGQLIKDSAKTAEKTIKNANRQHDKTVQSAKNEYKGRVSALKKLRDDSKTISESQYKALKKKAEDEKKAKIDAADAAQKGVVKQAKQQHKKTIEYAESQSKEVSKHIVRQGNNSIDSYNAQSVNANGVMKSILEAWNSFLKFFGQKPIAIAKSTAKQSAHISANSYANGGVARNGLALVGEAGPELVYSPYADHVRFVGAGGAEFTRLKAGEQVLNARDTKRLMDGSYSGILPGYAKGTSVLSSWLGKIKKASDKVLKKIPKSIKNMLKAPVKWINNLFSTKWDAPKTAYSFAHINEMGKLKDTIKKNVTNFIKGIFKKANKALDDAVESIANPGGAGVTRWKPYVIKALKANGIAPTSYRVSKILATIQRESGGNPKAINLWDSNAKAGIPSKGLMQTIGPTFNAYKLKGHNDIYNGFDNLLAAINYIKHKYGTSDAAFARVAASGYANGGLVTKDQLAHVAEGNNPEMIIPLSPLKRPRATQLTQQVVDKFNAESSQGVQHTNTNVEDKLDVLIDQFSSVLGQLKQVISNQDNPVPAIVDTAQAYSALNKYKKNQELKTKMLY